MHDVITLILKIPHVELGENIFVFLHLGLSEQILRSEPKTYILIHNNRDIKGPGEIYLTPDVFVCTSRGLRPTIIEKLQVYKTEHIALSSIWRYLLTYLCLSGDSSH